MPFSDRSAPIFYVLIQKEGHAKERLDASNLVLSFEYEDSEKKADQLKLTVDNFDLSNFDDPIWKPGNTLIVTWGYPGRMAPPRSCIIHKVTGGLQLQIEALDKSSVMMTIKQNRVFEGLTRSQCVEKIAEAYGFDSHDIEPTAEVFEHINQAVETDAQFVKRLADREGFEFYVDFDGLHWHPRRLGQKPLRVLQYYLPPDVGDIMSFTIENDIFAKPAQTTQKGRDSLKKKDISGKGDDASTKRDALAPFVVINPASGSKTSTLKNIASSETVPTSETSAAQAKKEADGRFKRNVQSTVKLNIEMVGDALVCAKSVLDVRGLGKRLSGLYYINQANHKIDSSGYRLSLKTSTDGTKGHSENLIGVGKPPASKKVLHADDVPEDKGKLTEFKTINPSSGSAARGFKNQAGKPAGNEK